MKIEKINIKDLKSPEYNPREISDKEMEKLKRSIKEFGYVDPIIVNSYNYHIVGGNQRFEAMKELGYDEVEVSFVHITDPHREQSLNIALNKISGEFDEVKLNEIFTEMKVDNFTEIELTGFEEYEIQELDFINDIIYDDDWDLSDDDLSEDKEDKSEEVTCPYCNKTFDLAC